MNNKTRRNYRLFMLITVIMALIIVPFFLWGDDVNEWFTSQSWFDSDGKLAGSHRGAAALVMFGLLASDILIPVPSSLVSTCCGLFLGFFDGFFVSFGAMCVSAAFGYLLGRFFSDYAKRLLGDRETSVLKRFQGNTRGWWLLLLRPVPVLAEASVLMSGIGKQPIRRVSMEVLIGNAVVSAVYAAVGAAGGKSDSMLLAFAGTIAISGLCMLVASRRAREREEA